MITIRKKQLDVPIIQGGMGVGVSAGNLAGAVARCGGMGVISTVNLAYDDPRFSQDPQGSNLLALTSEIKKAKRIADGHGIVAINAMVATTQYDDCIRTAIDAGIDAIISGAGLPSALPTLAVNQDVALSPIVSGGRAAKVICRLWDKHHGVTPDFLVIEGQLAGGHLGFTKDSLQDGTAQTLDDILPEVLAAIAPYEEKYGHSIPVFVAGGVYDGADMAHFMAMGAAGAQMATRFIATDECDASLAYKQQIVAATKDDIVLVPSPVGMPGRALRTPLIKALEAGKRFPAKRCNNCLIPCNPAETPYCISHALIEAVRGNIKEGLFFCGANAWRVDKIVPVAELIDTIMDEYHHAMEEH